MMIRVLVIGIVFQTVTMTTGMSQKRSVTSDPLLERLLDSMTVKSKQVNDAPNSELKALNDRLAKQDILISTLLEEQKKTNNKLNTGLEYDSNMFAVLFKIKQDLENGLITLKTSNSEQSMYLKNITRTMKSFGQQHVAHHRNNFTLAKNKMEKALNNDERPTERCPTGYWLSNGNKCYMFVLEQQKQSEANMRCLATNGRLVALKSADDQIALTTRVVGNKTLLNTTFWTAGYKANGSWSWGGTPFTFANWAAPGLSNMLTHQQRTTLERYLPNKKFKLLYRATRDGMSGSAFHSLCDHKGPTVSIGVEATTGIAYGGFTSLSWIRSGGWRADDTAFIFRLCGGSCMSAKYGVTIVFENIYGIMIGKRRKDAIFDHGSCGPSFGKEDLTFFCDQTYRYDTSNEHFSSNGYCYSDTYRGALECGKDGDVLKWRDVEVYQVLDNPGDCMVLGGGDQKWLREDCSSKHAYICEG